MKHAMMFALLAALAACGVDGEPRPPTVTGAQTIGYSSTGGAYSRTELGVTFGLN